MRSSLRSARIAPKKLNVIAQMVRGLPVPQALEMLSHTQKKASHIIMALLKSAVANATHNEKQRPEELVIRSIVVNQAQGYRRGVSMARGRQRPIRKFLSHIEIVLGVGTVESGKGENQKSREKASRTAKKPVQKSVSSHKEKKSSDSSESSVSSASSN